MNQDHITVVQLSGNTLNFCYTEDIPYYMEWTDIHYLCTWSGLEVTIYDSEGKIIKTEEIYNSFSSGGTMPSTAGSKVSVS